MTTTPTRTPEEIKKAKLSARAARMAEAASGGWKVVLPKIVALGLITKFQGI